MPQLARDVMARNLKTVRKDLSVRDAYDLMEKEQVRHLIITDLSSNTLIGIVSDRDLKRIISPFAGTKAETDRDRATVELPLEKIMRREVITVKPDDPLKLVVDKILKHTISAVPVVAADKKVLGIVSTTDLLRVMLGLLE